MEVGFMTCSYSNSNQIFSVVGANSCPPRTPISRQSAAAAACIEVKQLRSKNLTLLTRRKLFIAKAKKAGSDGSPDTSSAEATEKKGTIIGAVSLIVGTSIGSGILALPQKTSPAGFVPSAVSMIICWVFLVIEAILLAEINILLRRKKKKDEGEQESDLEVLSLTTMAQETLGEWGGNLTTITYLFLAYTSMVAYTSKSGEVLSRLINLPASLSGNLFTLLLALLILLGGTRITDQVNRWLTASMIGLLVTIEVVAISFGSGSGPMEISNWEKVPPTIPVIIFSLVYHDIAPVICAYLGGDLLRVRFSIMLGSLVPLLALLAWDDIALSLSTHFDAADPMDLLASGRWSSMLPVVETFSLLAVGTSLIGTLLGFSQFFVEQLINLFLFTSAQTKDELKGDKTGKYNARKWWEKSKLSLLATSLVILPSVLISTIVPDAFSVATDIAGGYCMIILYGVLPPTMAWAMHFGLSDGDAGLHEDKSFKGDYGQIILSNAKPLLVGVGLFSCGIVVEQILLDLTI